MQQSKFLMSGTIFGFILVKGEVISWFRIQEMFRFQSFHMYGIIGSAILIGIVSLIIIKSFKLRDIHGEPIEIAPKNPRQLYRLTIGGLLFGFGWALTGACPGPMFALLGSGVTVFSVVLLSALLGTYVYGVLQNRLPH